MEIAQLIRSLVGEPATHRDFSARIFSSSDFQSCITFKIQNGEVPFWEHKWMGSTSFCEKYINLFNLVF